MGKPPLAQRTAPPRHSVAAHRAHGWCARCPGRSRSKELTAWRTRDQEQRAADASARAYQRFATITDYRTCPECGQEQALAVVTVTALVSGGHRQDAGEWVRCLNCEAFLGQAPTVGAPVAHEKEHHRG